VISPESDYTGRAVEHVQTARTRWGNEEKPHKAEKKNVFLEIFDDGGQENGSQIKKRGAEYLLGGKRAVLGLIRKV